MCFDININYSGPASAVHALANFYDEGNAIFLRSQNNSIAYEAVAAAIWYNKNNLHMKNLYFSRVIPVQYNYMKFIGYRITRL